MSSRYCLRQGRFTQLDVGVRIVQILALCPHLEGVQQAVLDPRQSHASRPVLRLQVTLDGFLSGGVDPHCAPPVVFQRGVMPTFRLSILTSSGCPSITTPSVPVWLKPVGTPFPILFSHFLTTCPPLFGMSRVSDIVKIIPSCVKGLRKISVTIEASGRL